MVKKNKKTTTSKYTKWIWRVFFGGIAFVFLLFLLASLGVFGKLPTFEELENPEDNLATEVISIDGETLGKYYRENRTPVKFTDLPDNLIQALISTEDERFYDHSGIDFKALLPSCRLGLPLIKTLKLRLPRRLTLPSISVSTEAQDPLVNLKFMAEV